MTRSCAVLVIILAAYPSILAAQGADGRIRAAMERVREVGLTVEPLEVRVAEGRAKGVSEERIAQVVERRAGALIVASEALRGLSPNIPPTELAAGADAVEAGIPPAAIRQVAREAHSADRQVAISVLTYLHRERALPLEVALRNVSAALQRGSAALRELPAAAGNPGERTGNNGRAGGGGGAPSAGGPSGPGRQPGGGPPTGVPGPENRGNGGSDGPGREAGPGANPPDRGPGGSGPPGRGPDGNGPPGRGPGGGGPPGQQPRN